MHVSVCSEVVCWNSSMKVSAKRVTFTMSCILLALLLRHITTREYGGGVIRRTHAGVVGRYAWNRTNTTAPNLVNDQDDVPFRSDVTSTATNPSNAWRDGKKVVIFARMRTGSSFVGSIFGKNPEFYYSWEPFELYPVKFKKRDSFYTHVSTVAATILSHLLNCRFKLLVEDIRHFSDQERNKKRHISQWQKRLCTFVPRECPKGASNLSSYCDSSFKHTAVKLISVQNTSTLIPLMLRDVKVISLFRDPRSILASLMKLYPKLYKDHKKWKERSRDICLDILKNFNDALEFSKNNAIIAKNLALLRFEDVAFDTKTTVEKMYEFVGLGQVPEAVWTFLDNATHIPSGSASRKGSYSLYRQSSEVPYKWIKTLTWQKANAVQNACSVVMKKLGYEIISYRRFMKARTLFVNGSIADQDDPKLPALRHWRVIGGINSLNTEFLPDF